MYHVRHLWVRASRFCDQYIWINPILGETIKDRFAVLFLALQFIRLNTRINVFNELKKIKEIHPSNFGFDVGKWLFEMSRLYPDEIFISNLLDGAENVPCQLFQNEVLRIKSQ